MRLGEMLIQRGLLSQDELEQALELQKERGEKLGKILVDLGFVAHREVLGALSEQLQIRLVALDGPPPVTPETERLSPRFLRQFRCIPAGFDDSMLALAMADPLDFETIAAVRNATGLKVQPLLAAEQEILDSVERYYGERRQDSLAGFIEEGAEGQEDLEHLRDMASEAPVIRLVNATIASAVEKRASDIHIEPFEKDFRIRFRFHVLMPAAAGGTGTSRAQ